MVPGDAAWLQIALESSVTAGIMQLWGSLLLPVTKVQPARAHTATPVPTTASVATQSVTIPLPFISSSTYASTAAVSHSAVLRCTWFTCLQLRAESYQGSLERPKCTCGPGILQEYTMIKVLCKAAQHYLEPKHRNLATRISYIHLKESLWFKTLRGCSSESAISRKQAYFLSGNNKLVNWLESSLVSLKQMVSHF